MQKIKNFLNSEQTFYKVLDILNTQGDISKAKDGFIAGGSVANTLFYLLHGGKLVINDIDVYRRVPIPKEEKDWTVKESKQRDIWYPTTYTNQEGLEILDDNYGRVFVSETGARMRVNKHSRDGIFNNIEYIYEDGYGRVHGVEPKSKEVVIIEGFDLNNCKAGLDMINGKIIYTSEFVEFLKTKQMKVVNPCAPIQTTIRIYKKMKELGVYCDLKHEMRFLTVASKHLQSNQMTKVIGPETKQKYDKIKDFVEQYFVLREPKNSEEIPYTLRDTYYKDNVRNPDIHIWLYDAVMDFDVIENVGSINNFKRVWELLYTFKKKSEQDKINKIFYKNIFLGDMTEDQWTYRKYKNNGNWSFDDDENEFIDVPYYNSNRFTHMMILTKKSYHKCDFDVKHVDFIDKFAKEHYGVQNILKSCETLREQYNMVKFIKSLASKEGEWVIGSLENINWSKYKETWKGKVTKEFILQIIEDDKIAGSVELNQKVDLSKFKNNGCVKELNTTIELRQEGKKMGHCVGGYSNSIKSGDSRIFHVDCDGIGSTVEIGTPRKSFYHTNKEGKNVYEEAVEFYQPESWVNKPSEGWHADKVNEGNISKCIAVFADGTTEVIRTSDLKYWVRQHNGRYPEKGNLTPTDTNKIIVEELIGYLNNHHLPNNIVINFAKKEDSLIFV
jgi:hypothetical protein